MTNELIKLLEKIHDGNIRLLDNVFNYCDKHNIEVVEYRDGLGIGDDFITWAYINGEQEEWGLLEND